MRHRFFHTPRYLFLLLLGILLSAALVMPLPPRARAQQDKSRQLTQEETEKQNSNKRIALVIGNGAYTNAPRLKNPGNDATDVADALSRLGFNVDHGVDLNQRQMKFMIREFGRKLKAGGQGLFYYSGHGVQLNGHNFLIPVDADISTEADIEDQGVDAEFVLNLMRDAKNGLNVMILDACRTNPFGRSLRSAESGLAQVDAPTGTLIAYSTAPGRVAQDGTGQKWDVHGGIVEADASAGRAGGGDVQAGARQRLAADERGTSTLGSVIVGGRFLFQRGDGDGEQRDERGEQCGQHNEQAERGA